MLKMKEFIVRINPAKVYYLRFILEGYDNLFLVSTIDKGEGLVRILAVEGSCALLFEILSHLERKVGYECMALKEER